MSLSGQYLLRYKGWEEEERREEGRGEKRREEGRGKRDEGRGKREKLT
jgi:hypothetical protein